MLEIRAFAGLDRLSERRLVSTERERRIEEICCCNYRFAIKGRNRRLRLSDCCHLRIFERLRLSDCCQKGL